MIHDLEQIEYRRGMLEKGMKPEDLPVKAWRGSKIPADVRSAINAENLLNLGGVYGDKKAGDPMEYDNLKLVLTDELIAESLRRGKTEERQARELRDARRKNRTSSRKPVHAGRTPTQQPGLSRQDGD